MKKIITISSLMAFLIFSVNAQTIDKEKKAYSGIIWGLKAGINNSNYSVTQKASGENYRSLTGITGGVFVVIPVSHSFALQPELNYSSMGTNYSSTGIFATTFKLVTNYLSIPLLLKYTNQNGGFGVYAGPQFSFLTGAQMKSENKSTDAKEFFNNNDFMAVAGIDYLLPIGLHFDARYQLGLTNIAKDADPGESIKNNSFTITVGWSFLRHN